MHCWVGPRVGILFVFLTVTGSGSAQTRRTVDARATVNLDAIARREAGRAYRVRSVPKPQRSRARANGGVRANAVRSATGETEAAYPLYTGFAAVLDSYRTAPPDTGGAVGPKDVVTMLNAQVQIQSRSGEIRQNYPIDLNRFWSGLGNFTTTFDPRIQYDPGSERWIAAAGVDPGAKTAALLMGVSRTSDPGGDWAIYKIDVGAGGEWADYPVLGLNANWIVLSANIFRLPPAGAYDRTDVYVFSKSDLCAAGDGAYLTFSDSEGEFSVVRDTDNSNPAALYFVQVSAGQTGSIRVSALRTPGDERFTPGAAVIPVLDTWAESAPSDYDFAPQFGSWAKVYTGDSRLQNCVMRNGKVWCAHTIFLPADKPNRTAVQWFQIDPEAAQLADTGRIDDASGSVFYAFPSIAANRNGEVLIGYTRFTKTGYPDAGFALRTVSETGDALWQKTAFKRGEAPYIAIGYDQAGNRWGDFSGTVVDPLDDIAFWTIQEYAASPTDGYLGRWGTWWAQVIPPSAGLTCSYALSTTAMSFDATGGTGSITVTANPGCPWMATTDSGWLNVRAGASGSGSGTVSVTIAPKRATATLSGNITIAGQAVAVTQK